MTDGRPPGEGTRAVHPPPWPATTAVPHALPVHRSTTWHEEDPAAVAAVLAGEVEGFSYGRVDGPTPRALARAVAALDGAHVPGEVVAEPFASGMAALHAAFVAHLRAGDEVVVATHLYGGTVALLSGTLARLGVRTRAVDVRDHAAVADALAAGPARLLHVETVANPTLTVADLPALAGLAHDAGALLCVDATFSTPAACRPLEHGADLVVHSATKALSGHSDATAGLVVGRPEVVGPVREVRVETGGVLAPDEAYLVHRGLATLPLRVAASAATAARLAAAVAGRDDVGAVLHPALPDHPDAAVARRVLDAGRESTCVTLTLPEASARAGLAFCAALRLVAVAPSLGSVSSLASHVATTTHRGWTSERRRDVLGLDDSAVRLSVGLEEVEDLLADVDAALRAARDAARRSS